MQSPHTFYTTQKTGFESELKQQKRKLNQSSLLRFAVFLLTAFGCYLLFGQWNYFILAAVIGLVVFVALVFRHASLEYRRDVLKALIQYNEIELNVLNSNISDLPTGEEFINPEHAYSYDIDLFGTASFFQYINRTATFDGKQQLAALLESNVISDIPLRQEAIQNLSQKPEWRQYFSAIASLIKVETSTKAITDWLGSYKSFLPEFIKFLPAIFSILSLGVLLLAGFQIIGFKYVLFWLLLGLGITGKYLKKVNKLSFYTNKAKVTFQQYAQLLKSIEETDFTATILKEKQEQIKTEGEKASETVRKFSKLIDALDSRNNVFVALFFNGFMLWDLSKSYQIEKWITTHTEKVSEWFDAVMFFDVQNSLGNAAFNHPEFIYPEIHQESAHVMEAEKLGHPLLKTGQRVDNDFVIKNTEFFIVTGANMAGKSTFLRTVSLAIVMANAGLPICAQKARYKPIKLITSMRTTDSLAEGASYFFSELQRLKMIVDQIQKDTYFIILDEILKGTNSHDKALGSKKIVTKLASQNAAGIIATHDLSLCELEQELPQVKNYFFDAEIIDNELFFGYVFKKGICQNMNASFLLKKMEIVDD